MSEVDQATAIMLPPGSGSRVPGMGATIKATLAQGGFASTFEVVVPPGYDVGAHVHHSGAEMFYVLSGQLDILCFEPVERAGSDWRAWRSAAGASYLRGGPGAFMFVPPGTPHAFGNLSDTPTTMFFQSSIPARHENYFADLTALLDGSGGRPDDAAIVDLRRRYDIEQLTPMHPGRST